MLPLSLEWPGHLNWTPLDRTSTVIRQCLGGASRGLQLQVFPSAGLALIGWRGGGGRRDEAAKRGLKSWTEEAAQRVIGPVGILLERAAD